MDFLLQNKAVSTILNFMKNDNNIHGAFSSLIQVPQKYSLAVETLAGRALFNIVVENDNTAVKYINYLKENRVGSLTFLPLNRVKAKYYLAEDVLKKRGVIDYVLNVISFDRKYENIANLIFSDTLLIERIEDSKNIGIGKYKMITLTGDIVTKSGAMSGGFRARRKNVGIFKQGNLEEEIQKLQAKLGTLNTSLDEVKSQKQECEKSLYEKRENKDMNLKEKFLKLTKFSLLREKIQKS